MSFRLRRRIYPQPPRVWIEPLRNFVDTGFAIADGTGVALVKLSATPFRREIAFMSIGGGAAASPIRIYKWAVQPENLIGKSAGVGDADAQDFSPPLRIPPSTPIVVRVTGAVAGAQVSVRAEGPVHGMG